ncbi:MAG: hypothetical protein SFZ23_03975 [Planctomycetota bacterium]|nr:hypothetical protein [Planctomycetota bacterium]
MDLASLELQNADVVCQWLRRGADANRSAACRVGSIDRIKGPGEVVATGDLHDNAFNLMKLVELAGMHAVVDPSSGDGGPVDSPRADVRGGGSSRTPLRHLVLHEIIHSDRLLSGMDFSYRALARVAALKATFPEHVHVLLANHELSQLIGARILKDGVEAVAAFNQAVEYTFGDRADEVSDAIKDFIRSMPLALRCVGPKGDVLCAHSLPPPAMMARFDPTVLSRDLTPQDYESRRGSAHVMVWGRGYDAELLEDLVERWGVAMFILGHEKAEGGVAFVPPNAVVLNTDTAQGRYLIFSLDNPPRADQAVRLTKSLIDNELQDQS